MAVWPTKTTPSGVVAVRPRGKLNLMAASALREQLRSLVGSGATRLVVDLSEVDMIDSSGLGALLSGLKAARAAGGDLCITAPGPRVATVLKLTNLGGILKAVDSVDTAFTGA